ncbi:hypothetical protein, partial [Streptomyces sp. MBT59]|uniref:hypothetical protein n=1 Tax=Streptomyces sp. MBT59 TaxID=1488390 RepID=UPI001F41B6C8
MRARWTLGVSVEGVDVGAVPPDPWAVVVRSRGMGRMRTGGYVAVVVACPEVRGPVVVGCFGVR